MKIVRTKDVEWANATQKGKFWQRRKDLGSTGALSAGMYELPSGKKSFPFHMHHVTEEALFVVSGTGKVRTPDGMTPVGPGDWVAFPPKAGAHQLINDGAEPLVYVALGVNPSGVDIVEYPDSGKIASRTGGPPSGQRFMYKKEPQLEYFAGETDAE
jgi:uncharacterized cupin superfamily protein